MTANGASGGGHVGDDELRLALDLSPDPVALIEADGSVVASTAAWHHTLGHTRVDGPLADLLHPDDAAGCLDAVLQVAARRRPSATLDCRVRAGDGTWRWFEWTIRPDPGRRRAYLWGRDVDTRRRLEHHHRRLLDHAELLAVVGVDGWLQHRSRTPGPDAAAAPTEPWQ